MRCARDNNIDAVQIARNARVAFVCAHLRACVLATVLGAIVEAIGKAIMVQDEGCIGAGHA